MPLIGPIKRSGEACMTEEMKQYIKDRLKEPSTWRSIVMFVSACGVPIAPAMGEQIIAIGIAVSGIIGMLTPDKIK